MVKVRITEELSRDIDVYWLTDEEKALGYVMSEYEGENIVLDADDFTGVVRFEIVNEIA